MPHLNTKEVNRRLPTIPDWSLQAQIIFRTYPFEGFPEAIQFVVETARKAQKNKHHPDIDIRFDKVTLTLTSHDAGGLTEKDFTSALQCDGIYFKLTNKK